SRDFSRSMDSESLLGRRQWTADRVRPIYRRVRLRSRKLLRAGPVVMQLMPDRTLTWPLPQALAVLLYRTTSTITTIATTSPACATWAALPAAAPRVRTAVSPGNTNPRPSADSANATIPPISSISGPKFSPRWANSVSITPADRPQAAVTIRYPPDSSRNPPLPGPVHTGTARCAPHPAPRAVADRAVVNHSGTYVVSPPHEEARWPEQSGPGC